MNIEKLKQLAMLEQIGGATPPPEDNSRMAMGLIQMLMQQQSEKAKMAQETGFQQERLQQGQEGLDIRRDALTQQKLTNENGSSDKQLAIIMQLAEKGDPTAIRALRGMNPAYAKAGQDITNEANTARQNGVNAAIQSSYSQNANDPGKLKAYLDTLFASPVAATATPGATLADVNAAPWGDMNAGLPAPKPGMFSSMFNSTPAPQDTTPVESVPNAVGKAYRDVYGSEFKDLIKGGIDATSLVRNYTSVPLYNFIAGLTGMNPQKSIPYTQ